MTLRMLVKTASYGVHDDQIVGGASWGPNLRKSSTSECGKPATPFPRAADAREPMDVGPCGARFARAGHMAARAMDISIVVTRLSASTDRMLVDRTGLTGIFDWDLQWTPDALAPDITSSTASLPLVTALRDQLGLRLEPQRDQADVLVIDRAARPNAD